MAVFISVSTSPFEEVFENAKKRQPQINVRRPLRGIQIKQDTYAVIRVLTATGMEIPLFDSSGRFVENGVGYSTHYSNFIIQGIDETRVEKQQIVETFGEDYVFFFGERPRFLGIQGILLNTKDFNWKSEFWENYEKHLRGTRLVEQNARMYLYFDDIVVEGYLVQANARMSSDNPHMLPLQLQMFVTNYAILSTVGSVFFQEGTQQQPLQGLVPPGGDALSAAIGISASIGASGGGLGGFLGASAGLSMNASFSIMNTLDIIKGIFFGKVMHFPQGIGNQLYMPPIANEAQLAPAPTNQPIHTMDDEYVERAPVEPQYDEAELARVESELMLRDPIALELQARVELLKYGIIVDPWDTTMMLLGAGAFAVPPSMGSFGVAQAQGSLDLGI